MKSVQERTRAIFSQYGPELVKVNKKLLIKVMLFLTQHSAQTIFSATICCGNVFASVYKAIINCPHAMLL